MSRKVLRIVLGIMLTTLILMGCTAISEISATEGAMTTASTEREVSSPTMTRLALTGEFTRQPPPPPENILPTWTPLATLAPDLARDLTMELYENNPCRLPCWWNIVPGETNWNEAWQFLGQLATNDFPWGVYLQESREMPGYMPFRVYLPVPETYPDFGQLLVFIRIESFTTDFITVVTAGINDYSLASILKDYGEPQEIYVVAFPRPGESSGWLYLYYPNFSFLAAYEITLSGDESNTLSRLCVGEYSSLSLWPAGSEIGIDDMIYLDVPGLDRYSLEYVSPINGLWSISANELYRLMVNGNACIDLHPQPRFTTTP